MIKSSTEQSSELLDLPSGKVVAITTLNNEMHEAEYSGTDLLTLELPPLRGRTCNRQCYVPLVKEIVPEICVEGGWCQIDPPEGLLDLAMEIEERITIKGLLPPTPVQECNNTGT